MSDNIKEIKSKTLNAINVKKYYALRAILSLIKTVNPIVLIFTTNTPRVSILIKDRNSRYTSIISANDFGTELLDVTIHDQNGVCNDLRTRYYKDIINDLEQGLEVIKSTTITMIIPDSVFTEEETKYINDHIIKMTVS